MPQNFPITRDGLQIRTEQAWLHRPPTKAEQEQSGGEEEGSDEGEQGGNEEGGEQGGEEKQEEGGESEE